MCGLIFGTSQLIGAALGVLPGNYLKARTIFIVSFFAMAFLMSSAGIFLFTLNPNLTLVFICLHGVTFQAGIGCYGWMYFGKTFEAATMAISTMVLWGWALFFGLTTQSIFKLLTPGGTFLMFGITCFISGVFCLFFLKEI